MKRLAAAVGVVAMSCGLSLATARADEPIAGAQLYVVSHGQPICKSRAELQALLTAQVSEAPIGLFSFPGCFYADDNTVVAVGQDFVGGRYMHMVRVKTNVFIFPAEGYTFSAGLSPLPVRAPLPHLNPFY